MDEDYMEDFMFSILEQEVIAHNLVARVLPLHSVNELKDFRASWTPFERLLLR